MISRYIYSGTGTFSGVTYSYGSNSGSIGIGQSKTFSNYSRYQFYIYAQETNVGGGSEPEEPEVPPEPVYEYRFQVLATYVSVTKVDEGGLLSSIIAWLQSCMMVFYQFRQRLLMV